MKETETFTTSEAAEMLGVSAARIRQMVLSGIIEARREGATCLFLKARSKSQSAQNKRGRSAAKEGRRRMNRRAR